MLKTHPFGSFIPLKAKFLLLGSFPGRIESRFGDWFYETKRGQFWSIIEEVYGLKLKNKKEKQNLFTELKIAVTDIIYKCERVKGNNSDNNLINITYNTKAIGKILKENKIEKIFFSSRFVENIYRRIFKLLIKTYPDIKLITLPSSSARYAKIGKLQKIARYKELLPKLN